MFTPAEGYREAAVAWEPSGSPSSPQPLVLPPPALLSQGPLLHFSPGLLYPDPSFLQHI